MPTRSTKREATIRDAPIEVVLIVTVVSIGLLYMLVSQWT